MRYWNALAFCRDNLSFQHWTQVSLDQFSHALRCTRRNAQLLIKRLVEEEKIEWQSGVGRGNLPQAKLKQPLDGVLKQKATSLLKQGNVEAANPFISLNFDRHKVPVRTGDNGPDVRNLHANLSKN